MEEGYPWSGVGAYNAAWNNYTNTKSGAGLLGDAPHDNQKGKVEGLNSITTKIKKRDGNMKSE